MKQYGSYVSGLSIPTSDMDLIVCLPKVQLEEAPNKSGILEGRNSIKETWQQNLFRVLSKETWIESKSIKVIGNAAIPVLKLQTKELKSSKLTLPNLPSISLDISFEGIGNNGLKANKFTMKMIKKYPPIRPVVLCLKYFLSKHCLCEAYTGGLSSYGIFLLVTQFIQELELKKNINLESSLEVMDIGSILLSFLRFYGNCDGDSFDPRNIGVSVAKKCYFYRNKPMNIMQSTSIVNPKAIISTTSTTSNDRRHSFSSNNWNTSQLASMNPYSTITHEPYKFDPIYIDDPLQEGNNVGRNCFRIFQIQKCFSETVQSIEMYIHQILDINHGIDSNTLKSLQDIRILSILIGEEFK